MSAPTRTVHTGDALAWLATQTFGPAHAIITSLPDSSEIPKLGFDGWRTWFIETCATLCRALTDDAVAIFFQTDVKRDGRWIDKGHLVHLGADLAGSSLLWHKAVCRAPPGVTTFGRPAYAHMLCFSRALRLLPGQSSPDVIARLGEMTWARAMGVEACVAACTFLQQHTHCSTVVDPFCGLGTALAVANRFGMNAIGAELSAKRAEKARTLEIHLSR